MEKIYSGKVLAELKALAIDELAAIGISENNIEFEILEQPVKKLFGFKGEYKIKAIYNEVVSEEKNTVNETAVATDTSGTASPSSEKISSAKAYIEKVLKALGVEDFKIQVIQKEEIVVLDIVGEKLGIVIGRRGETLDSLQYLAILASNRNDEPYCRISVDCNGYRDKREETLKNLADRTAHKVLKQGRRITLEPMNPYERRIIHSKVAEIEGVYSNSIGEEPYRKVVISATQRHVDNKRNEQRRTGERKGNGNNRSYKQSSGFSTSFEREYKRTYTPATTEENTKPSEYSQETVEAEKNATLYGKIEF